MLNATFTCKKKNFMCVINVVFVTSYFLFKLTQLHRKKKGKDYIFMEPTTKKFDCDCAPSLVFFFSKTCCSLIDKMDQPKR